MLICRCATRCGAVIEQAKDKNEIFEIHLQNEKKVSLSTIDPNFTGNYTIEEEAQKNIERYPEEMAKRQGMMTHKRYFLLLIFQGKDAPGKASIIRSILSVVDPQACEAKMFKVPTEKDLRHDNLWRSYNYRVRTRSESLTAHIINRLSPTLFIRNFWKMESAW